MATGSQNLTTYYAKRIIGDTAAASAEKALLQIGTNVNTDTWILHKTGRATNYGIKYHYDYTSGTAGDADQVQFVGKGSVTAWVRLDTGDLYILGKVGIGYDPTTSGNTYKLYVNGTMYVAGATTHAATVTFANNTLNAMGDDCYIGDQNSGGAICIKGITGNTNIRFIEKDGTAAGTLTWDGSAFTISHQLTTSGGLISPWIELISATPFIDFHFGSSTADYTSRIIESSSGYLQISGKLGIGGSSTDYKLYVNGTSYLNGDTTINGTSTLKGPLKVGATDTAAATGYATADTGSKNYITFYGTYGDGAGSYNHTYIGESTYGSKATANEQSELLLFHGNDPGSGSGPDRIRLFAGQIDICVYTSATSGTWDAIRGNAGTEVANFANGAVSVTGTVTASSHIHANGGYLKSTLNGNTVTIGSQNTSFCHITNSIDIPFWFNKTIQIDGSCLPYTNKTGGSCGSTSKYWNGVYSYKKMYIVSNESTDDSTYLMFYASDNTERARIVWNGNCTNAKDNNNYMKLKTSYGDIRLEPASASVRVAGTLDVHPSTGSYTEGIRIYPTSSWATFMLLGNDQTATSNTSANSWGIFNNNGNLYITRNASSDVGSAQLQCVSNIWQMSNHLRIYTRSSGKAYTQDGSAIQIREVNCVGANQSSWAYAPKIGFHWSGRVALQLGMNSSQHLCLFNNNSDESYGTLKTGATWGDSVLINSNWVGFYNSIGGSTRYGYIQANADRMYFRKENGVSTYHFDFNGHIYTSGSIYLTSTKALFGTLGEFSSTAASDVGGLTWANRSAAASSTVNANDCPTNAWWYILRNRHTNTENNYYTDLAIPFNDTGMYYKRIQAGSITNGWVQVLSGDMSFSFLNSGTTTRYIRFMVGDNDYAQIAAGASASNSGWMEIATADDGNEPIYVRQYTGAFSSIKRTLTLLDANGYMITPSRLGVGMTPTYALDISGAVRSSAELYTQTSLYMHSHLHMRYNDAWWSVVHNYGNGNVGVRACGVGLYLGYANTTVIYNCVNGTNWQNQVDSNHTIFCSRTYGIDAFGQCAIEVRENQLVGATEGKTGWEYAPKIGFHWGNRCAGMIALLGDNTFRFINQGGGGYKTIYSGLIKSDCNSNVVTIGSQNSSYCHFSNSAAIPFWFNQSIHMEVGKTIGAAGTQYRPYQIYLGRNGTTGSNAINSANPLIEFSNSDRSQYCQLIYSDFDSVYAPDSLTLIGNQAGTNFVAPTVRVTGNLYVSTANTTGNGIILSDDGDIVDNNDGYCSMRFSSGVRVYTANRGGSATITLGSNGTISAGGYIYTTTYVQAVQHMYVNSGHYHMLYNNTWYGVVFNHGNANVSLNACSGGLYIGYSNTTLLDFMHGKGSMNSSGVFSATQVKNAVWNDYAECRSSYTEKPGYCVTETSEGKMALTTSRLQAGCKIISDTYGTLMGETTEAKTPIAVAGRVLVYPYRARKEYTLGAAVCSAPGGTVDIMTRDEVMMYPERIVGTVSEIPTYEIWHGGSKEVPTDIQVNGRIWVYVR